MPVILGETGNISRFVDAKHFAGYAGFVPVESESGPHKGEKHSRQAKPFCLKMVLQLGCLMQYS